MKKCNKLFVGMDLHKESIDIALAEEGGEVRHYGKSAGDSRWHSPVWCASSHAEVGRHLSGGVHRAHGIAPGDVVCGLPTGRLKARANATSEA